MQQFFDAHTIEIGIAVCVIGLLFTARRLYKLPHMSNAAHHARGEQTPNYTTRHTGLWDKKS